MGKKDKHKHNTSNYAAVWKDMKVKTEKKETAADTESEITSHAEPVEKTVMGKSLAKMSGLKSVLAVKDKVILTTFGRGNIAIPDTDILPVEIKPREMSKLKVSYSDNFEEGFTVSSKRGEISAESLIQNPLFPDEYIGMDQRGFKNALETQYFGKTFHDNIHIQVIYNILDIYKILTVQISNVEYALHSLCRVDEDRNDYTYFIDNMSADIPFNEFIHDSRKKEISDAISALISNGRLGYFGNVFPKSKKDDIGYWILRNGKIYDEDEYIYNVFAILGTLRQECTHASAQALLWSYDKDRKTGGNVGTVKNLLDDLIEEKIKALNSSYIDTLNKNNYDILYDTYRIDRNPGLAKEIVQDYFNFTILKSSKNIGFSVKKLREKYIESLADSNKRLYGLITDKTMDSVRRKLYQHMDFRLYRYYGTENPDWADALVEKLRHTKNDEEKESVYLNEIAAFANDFTTVCELLVCKVKAVTVGKQKQTDADSDTITKQTYNGDFAGISSAGMSYFSEMMYLLSLFLDGKEINDLLTTLINKFDNINSFFDVMEKEKIDYKLKDEYKFFNNSQKVSAELRLINSFARMEVSNDYTSVKYAMYEDAMYLLGGNITPEELKKEMNFVEKKAAKKKCDPANGFRNFIINNVINSSRFRYLVRYGNPKKLRSIAENKAAVDFVLSKIPDSQITRYYTSLHCDPAYNENLGHQRKELRERINLLRFDDFKNVNQMAELETRDAVDKAEKQTIISLYLTVLYILVKNLINVNSRYIMAYHFLEQDTRLNPGTKFDKNDYCYLTRQFIEKQREKAEACKPVNPGADAPHPERNRYSKKLKKYEELLRVADYLEQDMGNADNSIRRVFRNQTAHLSPIRNINVVLKDDIRFSSYFELYHYLVQMYILHLADIRVCDIENENIKKYLKKAEQNKCYCMDFVKAVCAPFGYNLPRFKNLTISAQFDRDATQNTKKNRD